MSAGGTASVVTPGALTLSGSVLNAERVNITASALTIESLQDSDAFRIPGVGTLSPTLPVVQGASGN